jgi:hypothetical protein
MTELLAANGTEAAHPLDVAARVPSAACPRHSAMFPGSVRTIEAGAARPHFSAT